MDISLETAEDLIVFHHLNKLTSVIKIAIKLQIFQYIGKDEVTIEELSKKLQLSKDVTNCLLNPLIYVGLLNKENNIITNSNCAIQYFTDIYYNNLSHLFLYIAQNNLENNFLAPSKDERLMIDAMNEGNRYTACYLASLLRSPSPLKVLDLGCGSGVFVNYISKYSPSFTFDCVDFDEVLQNLSTYISEDVYTNKVTTIVGDIKNLNIKNNYDIILMANILHFFSAMDIQKLIYKYGMLLEKNGRLVICDSFSDKSNLTSLLISLEWLTPDSAFPTLDQIKAMLKLSGFNTIKCFKLNKLTTEILICSKEDEG